MIDYAGILNRLSEMADANGRPVHSVQVESPTVSCFDAQGNLTSSVNLSRDISDRMRAELRQEAMNRGWDVR